MASVTASPLGEADLPEAKRKRVELNPDLPMTISAIPAVQELAKRNNAETRPRKRLRQMDFLNEAFYVLSRDAVAAKAVAQDVLALFEEFVTLHETLPRSATMAKVFYAWNDGGLEEEALQLLRALLACGERLTANAFGASFDEKVTTVTLRLVTSPDLSGHDGRARLTATERKALVEAILARAPQESLRRRVFTPLLAYARGTADWDFVLRIVAMAAEREIELWDSDYHEVLTTIEAARDRCTPEEIADRTERILGIMAEHQPVVGSQNAVLVHRLLGGSMDCQVSSAGQCSRCKQSLASFDLTEDDRVALLRDIEQKLIQPRVEGVSHYEPEKKVTAEEKQRRIGEYEAFKAALAKLSYDTVIDGANVGYYGLSSWYRVAKREELLLERLRAHEAAAHNSTAEGCDSPAASPPTSLPAEVLASIPDHPPFPVDVAPKFAMIESIRQEAIREGKKPLVILHSRHTHHGTPENMRLLEEWRRQQSFLASPGFLNDDYCWLYAAIVRPNTFVVSNDQMRDHHFLMLSPRFFVCWRQRHRITYKAFYSHETRMAIPKVFLPRCYSVWVQRAVLRGAHHWHVPYLASVPIIDQATNRTSKTSADVDLSKDGDDACSAWVCTSGE